MGGAVTLRPAVAADVEPLTAVLARAFYDDPPVVWMLPDPLTRLSRAARMFAAHLRAEALRHDGVQVACDGTDIIGGAIWLPPGQRQPGILDQLRALPAYMRALGRRLLQGNAWQQALARAHPREQHYYLSMIGVDPSCQGRGVASLLLRSRLRRCDQGGHAAYLEATKPASVPLYQHFGFEPTTTPQVPDGAPVITGMWRPPATPASEPGDR